MFLLKSLCRGLLGGKALSSRDRKSLPMFVFTLVEKGGLNQVTFLLRFFFLVPKFVAGSNSSLWLYPLLFSASWYGATELSNTSLFADIMDNLLFTPMGIFLMTWGGWLLLVLTYTGEGYF